MFRERLYIEKSNPLAALHPNAKGWIVILYCICVAILATIQVYGYALYLVLFFLVAPIFCAASGIWDKYVKLNKSLILLIAFIFIVQALIIKSDVVLFHWGIFSVYKAGLQHAILLCFLILNMSGILFWLFQTTEIKEMTRALEDLGMNYKAAFVFLSTFQMIEVLSKNSKTIMNAQRARGIETEGNVLVRSKAFFPSIVPLVVGSIMNTEERVLTLECRGFNTQCPKTHLFVLRKSGNESKAVAIAAIITIVILIGRIMLWVL